MLKSLTPNEINKQTTPSPQDKNPQNTHTQTNKKKDKKNPIAIHIVISTLEKTR